MEILRFAVLAVFGAAIVAGLDSLPLLFVSSLLLSALTVCFDVVAGACVPALVPAEHLVAANSRLLSVELTGEELVGQAAGGAVFALARSVPFLADAASFVASALLLRRAVDDNPSAETDESPWADLRSGLRWFATQPVLRLLAAIISTLAFCQAVVLGVMVLYAATRLHLHGAGYGLLLASAAAGNVIAGPLAPRVHRILGTGWCIAAAAILAALAYPTLAFTRSPVVAGLALLLETLAVTVGNVATRSLRQAAVPADMQGRTAAVYQTLILVTVPVGGVMGGLASAAIGIPGTFMLAGAVQLVLVSVLVPRLMARMAPVVDLRPESEVLDLTEGADAVPGRAA